MPPRPLQRRAADTKLDPRRRGSQAVGVELRFDSRRSRAARAPQKFRRGGSRAIETQGDLWGSRLSSDLRGRGGGGRIAWEPRDSKSSFTREARAASERRPRSIRPPWEPRRGGLPGGAEDQASTTGWSTFGVSTRSSPVSGSTSLTGLWRRYISPISSFCCMIGPSRTFRARTCSSLDLL